MLRFVNGIAPRVRATKQCQRSMSILPFYAHPYKGNGILGLAREEFSKWERRAPLCPSDVQELRRQGFQVHVQPSRKRVFTDREYKDAGAVLKDDLSECSLIIGVKQMNPAKIQAGKNYMFFSHTIKAQPQNMAVLDAINEKNARLFDYECITQGGQDGSRRLVAFGKYAGIAGMIDGLQGLGQKFLADGLSTPFINIPSAYMYQNLDQARYTVRTVGAEIERMGFNEQIVPIVFAFTGSGNVNQGAREIFELLPFVYLSPSDLPNLKADIAAGRRKKNRVYAVQVSTSDIVKHKDGSPLTDKQHYYDNPSEYVPIFHETILPYTTVLVNGGYWDSRYPRLVSNDQIKALRASGNKNLRMVADIACDPHGAIEFLTHFTTPERPFYSYNPERNVDIDEVHKDGICMMGIDLLPTELPRDASEHFGAALMPLLPPLLRSNGTPAAGEFENTLPPELKRACIASHGQLMPKWSYIKRLRDQASAMVKAGGEFNTNLLLTGHLFDTGAINKIFDYLDEHKVKYLVNNLNSKPNHTNRAMATRLQLKLFGDATQLNEVTETIIGMIEANDDVDGSATVVGTAQPTTSSVKVTSTKNVLLLGAGMVANPVIKLMGAKDDVHLTVASDNEALAMSMINKVPRYESKTSFLPFNYPVDMDKITQRIKDSHLVISLLPATMHVPFAEEAIAQKRDMVTASYVSDAMQKLDAAAKTNGVTVLNEVGLDPGIDHMLVMKAVDHIHKQGGKVKELISLCGGLPDPASADNPLRYKFSWSPKGVLLAARNGAVHLENKQVLTVPPGTLLQHAEASKRFPTMRLEALPNRDSLKYRELYSVPDVDTICRGTLRYEGWANVMNALQLLQLFEQNETATHFKNWNELLRHTVGAKSTGERELKKALIDYLREHKVRDVDAAVGAIEWLGMLKNTPLSSHIPLDALCQVLQDRLQFVEGEKDMVAMFHTVVGQLPDGTMERHTSRLLAFGTPGGDSAMAATVGYTTAVGAELLLSGRVNQKGVIIPTKEEIYGPMLSRLQELGVTYTESIEKI